MACTLDIFCYVVLNSVFPMHLSLYKSIVSCIRPIYVRRLIEPSFFLVDPGAPMNVSLVSTSVSQLRLSWKTPSHKNGEISAYYITWRIVRNDTNHTLDGKLITTVNMNTMSYNISGLGKCLQPF